MEKWILWRKYYVIIMKLSTFKDLKKIKYIVVTHLEDIPSSSVVSLFYCILCCCNPHEKVNQYLTNTENKVLIISIKYRFVSFILVKYRFTQISTLVIFNQCLTNTNQYISVRLNWYLTDTYRYILKSNIIV